MRGVNLEEVLKREKRKSLKKNGDEILSAFKDILKDVDAHDERIRNNIFNAGEDIDKINYHHLNPENIFNEEQIKKLCKVYRLRFLSSKYFKAEIPYEAIAKVRRLETEGEISNFKILAPAQMFKLISKDRDPLLFIPLGNKRYYLVHKWGSDLSWYRRLAVYPFRSFKTLLFLIVLIAFLCASLIPDSAILGSREGSTFGLRGVFFFYSLIGISGITALYGYSRMKNFNGELWNSRYLD